MHDRLETKTEDGKQEPLLRGYVRRFLQREDENKESSIIFQRFAERERRMIIRENNRMSASSDMPMISDDAEIARRVDLEWKRNLRWASGERTGHHNSFEYLGPFHIFVLAQILRRPILVYAGPPALGATGVGGIYLPVALDSKSWLATPLALSYFGAHRLPHSSLCMPRSTTLIEHCTQSRKLVCACVVQGTILLHSSQ